MRPPRPPGSWKQTDVRRFLLGLVVGVAVLAAACTADDGGSTDTPPADTAVGDGSAPTSTESAGPTPALRLEPVAGGFDQPVFYTTRDGREYVVEQRGFIFVSDGDDGWDVFLDIRDRVQFGGEQGLLGMAFHPDYPDLFYVDYTGIGGATNIAEFTVTDGVGDPDTERTMLVVPQPAKNHNGGMIAFGPDHDLWIGMGDGGGGGDTYGNGQRGDTLLGAMLRLTVEPESAPSAPATGNDFEAPEVWAIGLRNPWRFSFDGDTLWIADVGQSEVEEVDRVSVTETGINFGWNVYEGTDCYEGPCDEVDGEGRPFVMPVYEYRHDEGCSITGGYVYRGEAIPRLDGHYFFSDWCNGFIRSIAPDGTIVDWTRETGTVDQVTSFGRDESGEIYVVSTDGSIYQLVEVSG